MTLPCYNCSAPIEDNNLGRQDSCEKCGRDTHVCKNCDHYDPSVHNECRENQAMRVVEKEKANFCDWFRAQTGRSGGDSQSRESMKSAADALFGKK